MRSWSSLWMCLSMVGLLACGGADDDANTEATSGDEDPWASVDLGEDAEDIDVDSMEEEYPEQVADVEEEATGPARITVVNRVGNDDLGGNVSVLNASGEVVESGRSGSTFTLPAGTYRLAGEITSDDDVVGKPSKEMEDTVEVRAGQTTTLAVVFSVATVKLRVERNGRVVGTWRAELTRQGTDEAVALSSRDDFRRIRAGRYDGTVIFGANRIEVNDVIFQGGARGEVPIQVQ